MLARFMFGTEEIRMGLLHLVVAAALILEVAGCSSSPSASDSPSQPTAAATRSDPKVAAAPASATPDTNCLNGRYELNRFVGVGTRGTYGTGEGGDVIITFDNGSYLLRGAGKDPIKLTLAGQTADLLVDGTLSGDHRVAGNKATFTVGESTGSARLIMGSSKESVPMEQVGTVLAPNGEARLECADDALIVTLQDVRLEFGKV
jgi:hypothetical protein